MFFQSDNELLAFVHIEKAAGTTLIHLLRGNFFMRYCDVKPFSKASNRVFSSDDLKKIKRFNPALRCIFRNKLKPFEFSPYYEVKNVGNNKSPARKSLPEIFVKYKDEIIKRNQLDIELYEYVKTVFLPRAKVIYGPNFDDDLNLFKNSNNGYSLKNQIFLDLDYMVRKCYYELIFGIIRKKNGLPFKGSY